MRLFLALLLFSLASNLNAQRYKVEKGGITYTFSVCSEEDETASLVHCDLSNVNGNVILAFPGAFTDSNGNRWQVVEVGNERNPSGCIDSEDCDKVVEIQLPQSVKNVNSSAFSGCESLKRVVLPEGVLSLGDCAFYDCKSLETITLPASLRPLTSHVFFNCSKLKNIEVTKGSKHMKSVDGVLYSFSGRTLIYAPEAKQGQYQVLQGVDTIADHAFWGSQLSTIEAPNSLKYIGESAFTWATKLESILLPSKGVTHIGRGAFYNCKSLKQLTIPEGVTELPDLGSIEPLHIYLPSTLQSLDCGIDFKCKEEYHVAQGNNHFFSHEGSLYSMNEDGYTLLRVPETSQSVFKVMDGTTEIAPYAMWFNQAKDVTIPASVNKIGKSALTSPYFQKITFWGKKIDIAEDAFYDGVGDLYVVLMPNAVEVNCGIQSVDTFGDDKISIVLSNYATDALITDLQDSFGENSNVIKEKDYNTPDILTLYQTIRNPLNLKGESNPDPWKYNVQKLNVLKSNLKLKNKDFQDDNQDLITYRLRKTYLFDISQNEHKMSRIRFIDVLVDNNGQPYAYSVELSSVNKSDFLSIIDNARDLGLNQVNKLPNNEDIAVLHYPDIHADVIVYKYFLGTSITILDCKHPNSKRVLDIITRPLTSTAM